MRFSFIGFIFFFGRLS